MNMATQSSAPVKNEAAGRWEMERGGQVATLTYTHAGGLIVYQHTEVPPELEGHGVASALARAALDDARAHHLRVVPRCPFVASYIKRHPAYQDLVDAPARHAE